MLTRRLVWVAEKDGEVRGVLVAFAAHGFFYPVRVVGDKNGHEWLFGLLRKAASDAFERGYYYYVTHLDLSPIGAKLGSILKRRGATVQGNGWVGGAIYPFLHARVEEKAVVAC